MPIVDEKDYRDKVLRCPFCLRQVMFFEDMSTPFGDEIDAGGCECGARFVYDRSGRNEGEAYQNALAFAFEWDYDAVYKNGEPFEEAIVRYNSRINKFLLEPAGPFDRSPKYCFIKPVRQKDNK